MISYSKYGYIDELRKKRKGRKVRFAFLVIFLLITLAVFLIYALLFSGWFSVNQIQVSGNREVSKEEIESLASEHINKTYLLGYIRPFSNIFLTSSESIEHSLRKNYPIIERVNVNKVFLSKNLTIEITERESVGIWCKGDEDKCFYFDKNALLFKEASKFSGDLFLVIEDGRGRNFKPGDNFDDQELFEKINLTRNILDELKLIDYTNFFLPSGSFDFWIETNFGWPIYLDKENDIPTQLVALKKFLEEKLSAEKQKTLQYIDLRVNNRIYYK